PPAALGHGRGGLRLRGVPRALHGAGLLRPPAARAQALTGAPAVRDRGTADEDGPLARSGGTDGGRPADRRPAGRTGPRREREGRRPARPGAAAERPGRGGPDGGTGRPVPPPRGPAPARDGAAAARPPVSSGIHSSKTDRSKPCGECAGTAEWSPSAQRWSRVKAGTSRWVTATPLGVPVAPEVYMA